MNKRFTILYVDDEISNLNVFKNTFRRDYNIFTADSAKQGFEILEKENIDLILSDQRMPEMNGVDFLKMVMNKYPEPSRILITAFTDFGALKDAVNDAKVFQYIQKPWDEKETKRTIDNALEFYYLRQKNIQLTNELANKNIQLEKLNKELIELDNIKYQFLQIISHEIRTPLNGLLGATSLFSEIFENERFAEYKQLFNMLEVSTQRFSRFVLIAQRITNFKAEKYKLNTEIVNLNLLITNSLKSLESHISEKNIRINLDLCKNGNCNYLIDKELIEISISEILDNAIGYSDNNGTIFINTLSEEKRFLIEIIDNGPGFPENVLKNIFKPFITDYSISKEGMGLNLALIKFIIEAHHGSIKISNNLQRGAKVQLEF